MDEIALLYFQQLDKKLRSKCRLIAGSVELTETMKKGGKTYYRYRAIFRCAKTRRLRTVWLDQNGKVVPHP